MLPCQIGDGNLGRNLGSEGGESGKDEEAGRELEEERRGGGGGGEGEEELEEGDSGRSARMTPSLHLMEPAMDLGWTPFMKRNGGREGQFLMILDIS